MAVIAFRDHQAMLLETGPGITVEQVVAATEAELKFGAAVPSMPM
jgi:acetate CoA/acetoacetate CoA-transferase beta subunit